MKTYMMDNKISKFEDHDIYISILERFENIEDQLSGTELKDMIESRLGEQEKNLRELKNSTEEKMEAV
jgi:hypothetical protein